MAQKRTILLIDDDPDILNSIKVILEKNGYSTLTALSGKEGIELCLSKKPDLVLCDMMMESIDEGSKVASEIRKTNKSIPVYLLSSIGSATASNIDVDSLGFNGMFQKPVEPDLLIKSIKRVLKD